MQSNVVRVGLGVLLVATAVVLFIVLQDDDSNDESGTTASQTTATTGDEGGSKGDATPEKPENPENPVPVPRIVVKNGAPVGGVVEFDVTSGDPVRFQVISDEPGEVHVHGYEITEPIQAGKPVSLTFPADLQGGYEIELHSHTAGDIPIAELAVNPG